MRSKRARQPLAPGDAVIVASPGGGGYGNPLERPLEEVEHDLNLGYISRETAERDHGVVVAEVRTVAGRPRYRLDTERTRAARERASKTTAVPAVVGTVDEGEAHDPG